MIQCFKNSLQLICDRLRGAVAHFVKKLSTRTEVSNVGNFLHTVLLEAGAVGRRVHGYEDKVIKKIRRPDISGHVQQEGFATPAQAVVEE